MVSELKKDDVKEKPQVKPGAAEHHDEPNKFQKDAHGPEALAQHRMIRAGVSKEVSLPPVDLVSSIKNDGSAQTYHVKRGDTLSQIARDHLPSGASTKEVYQHVAEIAKANGITDPDKIKAGIDLKLPEKKAAEKPEAPRDGANDSKPGDRIPVPGKDAQPVPLPGKDAQPVPGKDAQPVPVPGKDAQPVPLPGKDAQAIPDPGQEFQPVHNVDSSIGKPVDQASMAKAAEAVEKALGPEIDASAQAMAIGDGFTPSAPVTDREKIMKVLGDKSPEEIKAISAIFNQSYAKNHDGKGIEDILKDRLSGHERDQAVDLFHRTTKADDPGRIHTALQEMHDWGGRSRANSEKDIRDTLATMNSDQIAQLDKEYKARYGTGFVDAINKDSKVSDETRAAVAIYAKGSENRTPQDTLELANLAIKAKNLDMFQEAFRDASPEARKMFMDKDGKAKITEAFSGVFSNSDVTHALDYVNGGKLDTITKIKDNIGVISNNDKAIDDAVKGMSDAERQAYMRGQAVAQGFQEYIHSGRGAARFNTEGFNKLTVEQQDDYNKYKQLHETLKSAGNESKVIRWEDMIAHKEETLASKLTDHGGWVNDKFDKVLSDLEGMGKQDFDRLKQDPAYRQQIEQAIRANYSKDELAQAKELLDRKLTASTFEESQNKGNRSTLEAIKDKDGFWKTDASGILDTLQKLTPEEQKKYRDDPNYKKELDDVVHSAIGGRMEGFAADRILDRVGHGLSPKEDIVGQLLVHSKEVFPDHKAIIGEIEAAFKEDPALAARLKNPQTDADKAMAEQFRTLGQLNLGGDFDKYVKPLVENGSLPFAEKAQLYNGWFSNDTKGLYDAIKTASPQDQAAIAADPAKILPFLSGDERQVAANIAKQQGEMKPEDQMRGAILGMSGDKQTIKDLGSNLTADQRAQLSRDYEAKYGRNLMADLVDKLGGQDKVEAERNFRALPQTSREAFNAARDEEYKSNDGIGRAFVRNAWDGTSDQSRDDLNKYAATMGSYSSVYRDMPVAQSTKMAADLTNAVDLYRKSKGAAADAVVDGTIIVAGVGGAAFTGGVSLGLIATTGLAGAAFKVGTKATIMGDDYDTGRGMVTDAATGAIDAATVVVGPAQIAKMFKIGEAASVAASGTIIAESTKLAEASGRQILKAGAEETLAKDLSHEVSSALAHGANKVDDHAIDALALKYAETEADRVKVRAVIVASLNEAIASESSSALKTTLREVALNSGAGGTAGGSSGVVRGAADWDPSKSVDDNLAAIGAQGLNGMASGAIMGGGATVGFKALGRTFGAVREAVTDHLRPSSSEATLATGAALREAHGLTAVDTLVKTDRNGRVVEVQGPNPAQISYHRGGELDGQPAQIKFADGTSYENTAPGKWRVVDKDHPQGAEIQAEVKVSHRGEVEIKGADGSMKTLFSDGVTMHKDTFTGITTVLDGDGRIMGMRNPNGDRTNFRYSADNQVSGVEYAGGRSIFTEDGGKTWLMKEPEAAEARKIEGSVSIDDKGAVHIKALDGQPEKIYKGDGAQLTIDPVSGKPSEVVQANGSTMKFEYGPDGSVLKASSQNGSYAELKSPEPGDPLEFIHYNRKGQRIGAYWNSIEVSADGVITTHRYGADERLLTDGTREIRAGADKTLARRIVPKAQDLSAVDVDGRTLAQTGDRHLYIEEKFNLLAGRDEGRALKSVEAELKDVKAIGPDGKSTSAYDSLMKEPSLSDGQKENVLRNLAVIREHLASFRDGDRMHGDPEVNWIHTQGELAKVLEVARAKKLSSNELEDTLLASMYSDAVKFAFPPPQGALANFHTHHLDGALAAHDVLTRRGFPPERVERIVEAIKAHQIAPPEFMGRLYYMKIAGAIEGQIREGKVTQAEGMHLREVLAGMSSGEPGDKMITKIAKVGEAPKVIGADGHLKVAFTDEERKVLGLSGTDTWTVPYDPKLDPGFKQLSRAQREEALSRQRIAQTLIDGDGIDNYATTGGASKIVAIRGPETFFQDHTVWDSVSSIDSSYRDAYSVMSPEARRIADANYGIRTSVTDKEMGPIKAAMDDWLRSVGRDPDKPIPFYNADLQYPMQGAGRDGKPIDGLPPKELKDFEFAKQIRAKMTELLRRDHRTDGSLPGNFQAATGSSFAATELPRAALKRAELKLPGTSLEDVKPGDTWRSSDGNITAFRRPDDQGLMVTDFFRNENRQFDSDNRILAFSGDQHRVQYSYDAKGELKHATIKARNSGETTELTHTDKGWIEKHTDASGQVSENTIEASHVFVDADGTIKLVRREGKVEVQERYNPDGSKDLLKPTGRVEYLRADYQYERVNLEHSLENNFGGETARIDRLRNLLNAFELESVKPERGLTENDRALVYKQLNRLISAGSEGTIPISDRLDLAEQALDHSAHPWSIDQGQNSTCNVTVLEHRNYWRNPDKNIQILADIAMTGKTQFASGQEVQLKDISGELKPDVEARHNLKQQREGLALGPGSLKRDGGRDYSSQLLETAMVNHYWSNKIETIDTEGRILTYPDVAMRFDSKGQARGIVDHREIVELHDAEGKAVTEFKAGEKYYKKDKTPIKDVTEDKLIFDDAGRLQGFVADPGKIKQVYDINGKPVTSDLHLNQSDANYFDEKGNLLVMTTRPGDLHYEKVVAGPDKDLERVVVEVNGKPVELKKTTGEVIDAPKIYTNDLAEIGNDAAAESGKPFIIGHDGYSGYGTMVAVDSKQKLVDALKAMKEDDNLPAVLQVDVTHPPFNSRPSYDEFGNPDNWHLINIQDVYQVRDAQTGEMKDMIRFTNQWGSSADYLKDGIDAELLYNATKPAPKKEPAPPPKVVQELEKKTIWQRVKGWFSSSKSPA